MPVHTQPNMHCKNSYSPIRPVFRHLASKLFQLILFCFICFVKTYGQTTSEKRYGSVIVEITKLKRKISPKVETKVDCAGADSSWVQSLEKKVCQAIAEGKRMKKGKYLVKAKFILSKDGSLSDIACENNPGFGICDEIIRVLKKTKTWIPAEQRGKAVRDFRKG